MDPLEQVAFRSERLVLKVLKPEYAGRVLAFYEGNRDHLEPWEPPREDGFYSEAYHEHILKGQISNFQSGFSLNLWVFESGDTEFEKVLGAVNFSNIIRGPFQSCFLGYKMCHTVLNRGYMTEAIAKGLSIMFDGYKLHRVEANVIPRNGRSLRVVEKLGFHHEGYSPKYLKINGIWEDHERFAILNPAVE